MTNRLEEETSTATILPDSQAPTSTSLMGLGRFRIGMPDCVISTGEYDQSGLSIPDYARHAIGQRTEANTDTATLASMSEAEEEPDFLEREYLELGQAIIRLRTTKVIDAVPVSYRLDSREMLEVSRGARPYAGVAIDTMLELVTQIGPVAYPWHRVRYMTRPSIGWPFRHDDLRRLIEPILCRREADAEEAQLQEPQTPESLPQSTFGKEIVEQSNFPKLMRRLLSGEIPGPGDWRKTRTYRKPPTPELTEEQMIRLGQPNDTPKHRRGRG